MTRWILLGFLAGFIVSSVPAHSVAQQYPATYLGSGIVRVPARGKACVCDVVPRSADIGGATEVTYIWRLQKPLNTKGIPQMPKGVWLYYHEHQDPHLYTSRSVLSGFTGFAEASWHSGYEIVNTSSQEVVLEVRYVAWGGQSCRWP